MDVLESKRSRGNPGDREDRACCGRGNAGDTGNKTSIRYGGEKGGGVRGGGGTYVLTGGGDRLVEQHEANFTREFCREGFLKVVGGVG